MGTCNIVMTIPIPGVGLYESNSFFYESAGKEAFSPESVSVFLANAVFFESGFLLAFEIKELWDLRLHTVR